MFVLALRCMDRHSVLLIAHSWKSTPQQFLQDWRNFWSIVELDQKVYLNILWHDCYNWLQHKHFLYVDADNINDADADKVDAAVNALPNAEGIGELAATSQGAYIVTLQWMMLLIAVYYGSYHYNSSAVCSWSGSYSW